MGGERNASYNWKKKQEKRQRLADSTLHPTVSGKTFKIHFLVNEGLMDMCLMKETDVGKDYQNFRNHYLGSSISLFRASEALDASGLRFAEKGERVFFIIIIFY